MLNEKDIISRIDEICGSVYTHDTTRLKEVLKEMSSIVKELETDFEVYSNDLITGFVIERFLAKKDTLDYARRMREFIDVYYSKSDNI